MDFLTLRTILSLYYGSAPRCSRSSGLFSQLVLQPPSVVLLLLFKSKQPKSAGVFHMIFSNSITAIQVMSLIFLQVMEMLAIKFGAGVLMVNCCCYQCNLATTASMSPVELMAPL